jgi:hypothetical protein
VGTRSAPSVNVPVADIRKFEPRLIQGGKKDPDPNLGVIIACHCQCTLFEITSTGVVQCTRCKCAVKVKLEWQEERL